MKNKLSLITLIFIGAASFVKAQTIGPAQQRLLDSLCNSMSKIDMSKLTTKKLASDAFLTCFSNYGDLVLDVAKEQNLDLTDNAAMHSMGLKIGENLVKQKCPSFMNLAVRMAKDSDPNEVESTSVTGKFKRIDNKGFNYIVITDTNNSEKSFIWLRQFPGSEKFINNASAYVGKRLTITSNEIEVFLPSAKGYYKVKEITAIDIL